MNNWFDALAKCAKCHKSFSNCECVAECELCGGLYQKESGRCDNSIHRFDAEARAALQKGFWRIDDRTGRIYKTRAVDLKTIYKAMRCGNFWTSRKQYNDDIRAGVGALEERAAGITKANTTDSCPPS